MPSHVRTRLFLFLCSAMLVCLTSIGAVAGTRVQAFSSIAPTGLSAVSATDQTLDAAPDWQIEQAPHGAAACVCGSDVDDEPALAMSASMPLEHARFDAPISVTLALRVTPAVPLPRPPNLA